MRLSIFLRYGRLKLCSVMSNHAGLCPGTTLHGLGNVLSTAIHCSPGRVPLHVAHILADLAVIYLGITGLSR